MPDPGARDRAGLQAAQADPAGAGLRQGDPAQRARGGLRRRPTTPTHQGRLLQEWDERNLGVPLKVLLLAVPRDRPADRRVRHRRSGRPTRAAWSRSTSRSTSSAAGGSSCCTTRPRCGSRAGCCSRPGVMVTSVPYQLQSSQIAREREQRERAGSRPATCAAATRPQRRRRCRRQAGPPMTAAASRRRPRERAPRGARTWGSGSRSRSARSPTAATASPRHDEPGGLRPARAARGAGRASR